MPNRCSIVESGRQCVSPPAKVVSIASGDDEYMVGVTCAAHASTFMVRVKRLQQEKSLEQGTVHLKNLGAVGTDCLRSDGECTQ